MGKKHKHKHKHKHKDNKSNCDNKGDCGKNCQCDDTEHLYIEDEAEMLQLFNIIVKYGEIKAERWKQKDIKLSNDMLADAGVTEEEMIPEMEINNEPST